MSTNRLDRYRRTEHGYITCGSRSRNRGCSSRQRGRHFIDDDYHIWRNDCRYVVFPFQTAEKGKEENGDCVLTTSGFIGIVIDINDDTVIVEFGNNKNCRIPMEKSAISRVEKPGEA